MKYKLLLENWKNFINEVVTDIVYHATGINRAVDILKSNKFMTSVAGATDSERRINRGRFYYFSTARSMMSRYLSYGGGTVVFVLNGQKLSQRYKGFAIDYWGPNFPDSDEMEDRVITNKPYIENVNKYINEIHVSYVVDKNFNINDIRIKYLQELEKLAKEYNIPLFIYISGGDWKKLNKKKAFKTSEEFVAFLEQKGIFIKKTKPYKSRFDPAESLKNYVKIIKTIEEGDKEKIKSLDSLDLRELNYVVFYIRDFVSQIKNEIHNNRSKPEAREPIHFIFMYMKKKKFESFEELGKFLQEKRKEILYGEMK